MIQEMKTAMLHKCHSRFSKSQWQHMLFAAFLDPRYKKKIGITDADLDAFQNKVKKICQESASVVPYTESQELVAIESSSVLTTISTTTPFSKNTSTTTSSTPSTS